MNEIMIGRTWNRSNWKKKSTQMLAQRISESCYTHTHTRIACICCHDAI